MDLVEKPHPIPWFERMFGAPAAKAPPLAYRFLVLGPEAGLDIHVPFSGMLHGAPKLLRHEDAFTWLAMSKSSVSIHCALLDCLLRQCCDMEGLNRYFCGKSSFVGGLGALSSFGDIPSPGGLFRAYALMDDDLRGSRARLGVLHSISEQLPFAAPGALCSPIEGGLSSGLARSLSASSDVFGQPNLHKTELFESACEAIALAASTLDSPAHRRASRL